MIKTETVRLKVSSSTKQHYSNLGYDFTQKEIYLKISDLKLSSMQRIDAICDTCGDSCNIQYAKYIKNVKNNGIFSCKNCYRKKCYERFTNDNPSLNPNCIEMKRETSMKNYGVDHPAKSEKVMNKISETNMKKYGVKCTFELVNLVKEGMLRNHNVDSPLKSQKIKEKMLNTLVKKYGVDNVSKIDYVKDKKILSCLLRNGAEHHMQIKEFFDKFMKNLYKLKRYKDTNLYYQASYELDFLNYCEKKGIMDLISNGPSVEYILESSETNHTYHSDFFIKKLNLIIEIKSNYTYNSDLDKNLMKEKYCLLNGYNFIFVIDKDYSKLNEYIKLIYTL